MWKPIKELLMSLMTSALGGFDDVVADAADVLCGDNITSLWNSAVTLSNVLRPFCYTIIALCMMIEIAGVASKVDIIKFEHGLKLAVKMCLAKVFIDIAPMLLLAIYRQAQTWIHGYSSASSLGRNCLDKLEPLVDNLSGLGGILGIFLSTFIVLLAIKVCGLMVMVMAYGRVFEVLVYVAVSPIPCAFFPLGNGDGGGFSRTTAKFLRSFAAVCLQGVMMMAVLQFFSVIIGAALDSVIAGVDTGGDVNAAITNLIYTMLLGSVSLVMAITKCGSWAKGILDAM